MSVSSPVRTRMAPSPTGELHVGSLAILLKNYAYAKKHNGKFVLRIEDTDQVREVPGAIEEIKKVISDYGLDWDEGPEKGGEYGPYIQSQRLKIYQQYAQQLVDEGKAYHCFCSKERLEKIRNQQRADKKPPKYDRHCLNLTQNQIQQKIKNGEPYVIRLKVPGDVIIKFNDLIRGEIQVSSNEVDDQVLLKSDGFPTYHLAVVIDDHLMKISHVMRGEEWISSTPKRVLLYEAFGWTPPIYAHIPIFLNPNGQGKMSKRQGAVSARSFLERGYLPEAMLNFLMILGWTREDQTEIMTLENYIQEFDPSDVSAKSVVFDLVKLKWMNGVYIRQLSDEDLSVRLQPFLSTDFPSEKLSSILPLVKERLETLADFKQFTDFMYRDVTWDKSLILKKADRKLVTTQLKLTLNALESLSAWSLVEIEQAIRQLQDDHKWHRGQYFMMLRQAVTGRKISPPLFETMEVMKRKLVQSRLAKVMALIA